LPKLPRAAIIALFCFPICSDPNRKWTGVGRSSQYPLQLSGGRHWQRFTYVWIFRVSAAEAIFGLVGIGFWVSMVLGALFSLVFVDCLIRAERGGSGVLGRKRKDESGVCYGLGKSVLKYGFFC
jgi:hypothetical protein